MAAAVWAGAYATLPQNPRIYETLHYDIGEHGSDAFIVMEHFAGGTVAERLREARDGGRRLPRATAMRWLAQAAAGLDVAHAAGIVHRDVKPANLLLDAQGRLAVADFGIARLADDTQMTKTGQVLGTAAYISPEQALGQPASPASDRYALAVVAFELLSGARPFAGGPPTAQAMQHAAEQPLRASQVAPDLPAAVDAVFAAALAKDPGQRPRTAGELVSQLERALDAREPTDPTRPIAPVAVAPPSPRRVQPRQQPAQPPVRGATPRRGISPLAAIVGVIAVLTGAAVALLLLGGGDDANRSAASGTRATATTGSSRPASGRTQASTPSTTPPAATAPTQTQTGQGAATSSRDPKALSDRGYALNQAGDYQAALAPLRASVDGYQRAGATKQLAYAYALFNYAVALRRTGDPADAIPLLRQRLRFDNQRGVVRKELAAAQAQAQGAAAGTVAPGDAGPPPAKPGKGDRPGKAKVNRDRG